MDADVSAELDRLNISKASCQLGVSKSSKEAECAVLDLDQPPSPPIKPVTRTRSCLVNGTGKRERKRQRSRSPIRIIQFGDEHSEQKGVRLKKKVRFRLDCERTRPSSSQTFDQMKEKDGGRTGRPGTPHPNSEITQGCKLLSGAKSVRTEKPSVPSQPHVEFGLHSLCPVTPVGQQPLHSFAQVTQVHPHHTCPPMTFGSPGLRRLPEMQVRPPHTGLYSHIMQVQPLQENERPKQSVSPGPPVIANGPLGPSQRSWYAPPVQASGSVSSVVMLPFLCTEKGFVPLIHRGSLPGHNMLAASPYFPVANHVECVSHGQRAPVMQRSAPELTAATENETGGGLPPQRCHGNSVVPTCEAHRLEVGPADLGHHVYGRDCTEESSTACLGSSEDAHSPRVSTKPPKAGTAEVIEVSDSDSSESLADHQAILANATTGTDGLASDQLLDD